jgi:hypothetical protein
MGVKEIVSEIFFNDAKTRSRDPARGVPHRAAKPGWCNWTALDGHGFYARNRG